MVSTGALELDMECLRRAAETQLGARFDELAVRASVPVGLDRLVLPPRALLEARRLVAQFQRFHLGLELRSERFLDQMLSAASAPGSPQESARR